MWHPSSKLSFKRRRHGGRRVGRCGAGALPLVFPVHSLSASRAAHAIWLCVLLVAACVHSSQVNSSRLTGFQSRTCTPAVAVTHKTEHSIAEREALCFDGDDCDIGSYWRDVGDHRVGHLAFHRFALWPGGPTHGQPPIRAPPSALV